MRVFIALDLPDPVRKKFQNAARRLQTLFPGLAVPRPESLHLTLYFFGEREAAEVDAIRSALLDASLRLPVIDTVLGGFGTFPPAGPVRVVYAAMREGGDRIRACREMIGLVLKKNGIVVPDENRWFTPHLTLGRCRSGSIDRKALAGSGVPDENIRIDRCVFYQSILDSKGARYRPLVERILDG